VPAFPTARRAGIDSHRSATATVLPARRAARPRSSRERIVSVCR
jgi:hypothetical protein